MIIVVTFKGDISSYTKNLAVTRIIIGKYTKQMNLDH